MAPKLLLIDGHALAYRGFHATAHGREIMMTSAGEWTNAVYVFVSKLLKAWREERPEYIVVTFDIGKSFRHEQFQEYKANRSKMPDELRYQLERIDQVVQALNIPAIACEGYEADDVIGTLARQATENGVDTLIMTGDTDILQLVSERVQVLMPRGRYGDDTIYGPDELAERYQGLSAQQLIDLKALVGDTSDNIPGLRGIGQKTASSLLQEYGTVEGIYDHLDEIRHKRVQGALNGRRQDAELYKDLITIRQDAPVTLDWDDARADNFDRSKVIELFRELEFHSLVGRVPVGSGAGVGGDSEVSTARSIETQYVIVDTIEELDEMARGLEQASAIAFDTETTSTDSMNARLVGMSFAVSPGKAWYIPVGHGSPGGQTADVADPMLNDLPLFASQERTLPDLPDGPHVSVLGERQLELEDVVERLRPALENPDILKYAHNASYDVVVLAQTTGIQVRGLAFDTMVAGWVMEPASRRLGLKSMAYTRLGIEMTPISDLIGTGRAQITMDRVSVADAAPYACADADMTLRLVESLSRELREAQQWGLYTEIEMPLVPILIQMEMAGVRLDTDYLRQMGAELEEEQQRIEGEIFGLAGHSLNVNSSKQLSELLFVELGLSKRGIRKTTHGYSTAADALALLRGKHPIIEMILKYRQIAKLRSTYVTVLPTLVHSQTGRIHTSYNQTGTVTGRLSSSNPNLQNIPNRTELGRQIRRGFVPEDGWVFVAADYSQIELRVLAHVSQDATLLDAFGRDQDIHARTAAAVYDVELDQVTKQQRQIAKTVNFGLIYGQSAFGLSQQTELDYGEAERFIAAYFDTYPGVKAWLERTRKLAYAQGYVETLLGRRRYFPELHSTQRARAGQRAAAERQAINAPIQGTAADILKIAMIRLDRRLSKAGLDARMVLQVHDEIVLEVPRSEVEAAVALTREVMERAYELNIPLKVDVELGENWLEMETI